MTPDDAVLGLFKFGQLKYIEQFVHGRLYMNTLAYFSRIETNFARRDVREGENFWLQPSKVTLSMKIAGKFTPIPGIVGPIAFRHESELAINVFCMYALRACAAKSLVDPRNFVFGDTFAVLRNGDEFLRRVSAAAQGGGHQLQWNAVEYLDKSEYHGPMGVFRKSSEFSYQSEFRIALLPGYGSPYTLEVGDLSDLVIVGPLAELNDRLKIE